MINVQAGQYLYIGSAMALKGSTCLARRLLRHASRCGLGSPHAIRDDMMREFSLRGLTGAELQAPVRKTLRWNVDHLLDKPSVNLIAVYIVRCKQELESKIGDLLEDDSATVVFEQGLGANDRPGQRTLGLEIVLGRFYSIAPREFLVALPSPGIIRHPRRDALQRSLN